MAVIEIIFCLLISIFLYILYIRQNKSTVLNIKKNDLMFTIINENNKLLNKKKINLMTNVITNMYKLKNYLYKNIDKYPKHSKYINLLYLNLNINKTNIYETVYDNNVTSYTINKGEKIFLCLKDNNELHDINIIMYVDIHELAHLACPSVGHDTLFQDIFKFLIETSILINIYKYNNYHTTPSNYCNIKITSNIL